MAKKAQKKREGLPGATTTVRVVPAPAPKPESLGPAQVEGFTTSEWCGRTRWACDRCPFATLSLDAALEHRRTNCGKRRLVAAE